MSTGATRRSKAVPGAARPGAARPSPATIAATALVTERLPAALALGRQLAGELDDPAAFVGTPRARASPRSPTRTTWPASGSSRPGSARRSASATRSSPPWRAASRPRPAATAPRPPPRRRRRRSRATRSASSAGSPSASSSGPSPVDPERTWQVLRRIGREAGRLDHRRTRSPHVAGRGDPRRAVPLGGARAARLLAVALGAPPRRLHGRHDPVHRTATAGRDARGRAPRPRASSARSSATPSRTSRRPSRGRSAPWPPVDPAAVAAFCASEADRAAATPTATAPGSSATPCRSSPPPMRPGCAPALGRPPPASRRAVDLRARPRPRRPSSPRASRPAADRAAPRTAR